MKIERLNEHQIRCTLTREDLAKRGLRLSEFAYGTRKARALFQDMMEQASFEVGFEPSGCPLMIEAVPMGPECLVLIVTQVEDPEELDTRFSVFGPMLDEADDDDPEADDLDEEMEDNTFSRLLKGIQDSADYSHISEQYMPRLSPGGIRQITQRPGSDKPAEDKPRPRRYRIFAYSSMHDLRRAAGRFSSHVEAYPNTLYRGAEGMQRYYLVVHQIKKDKADAPYIALCTMLAEYGADSATQSIAEEYLKEHCEVLIKDRALQKLAEI
ncbi:MAG: adaptor protein MecA [Lachnospiraceae bacterium]|nr:adaptor protein MecA [Lachnospiraceae bacterium]